MTCCSVSFCLCLANGFFFFFCLETKEKETKRKNQGWTSPGLLRKGRSGAVKPNSLRFTTLRQGFPTPPVHSSAHAPPPRPFHYTPMRFAVGFWLWLFVIVFLVIVPCCLFLGLNYGFWLILFLVICFIFWFSFVKAVVVIDWFPVFDFWIVKFK